MHMEAMLQQPPSLGLLLDQHGLRTEGHTALRAALSLPALRMGQCGSTMDCRPSRRAAAPAVTADLVLPPGRGQAVRRAGCPHPASPRPRALLARALSPQAQALTPPPRGRWPPGDRQPTLSLTCQCPPSFGLFPRVADEPEHPEGLTQPGEGAGVGGAPRAKPCSKHSSGCCGSFPQTRPPRLLH